MAKTKASKTTKRQRKPSIPDLTEVQLTGLVGGEITVETMDDLWNWAAESEGSSPAGVALHVVGAYEASLGKEGQTAALSLHDLDNLIDELIIARDVVRARHPEPR